MKTLDEVIKALEWCIDDSHDDCDGCPYDGEEEGCHHRNLNALHYLKAYREDKEELTALRAYWAEQQANVPLDWEALKQMEGKPVWVEAESLSVGVSPYWKGWYIINSFSDDEFIHCNDGYEWAKEMQGRMWQAYRKERE